MDVVTLIPYWSRFKYPVRDKTNNQITAHRELFCVTSTCATYVVCVRPLQTFERAVLCAVSADVRSRYERQDSNER
jgi:hypothetical protein